MKRYEALTHCLNNLLGVIELFYSAAENRAPVEKKLEKTEAYYINKMRESAEDPYEKLNETLVQLVRQTCNLITEYYSERQVRDFSFLLAGLCDELMINSHFSHNEKWRDYLVERTMFNTSISGEHVFEMIGNFIQMHPSKDNDLGYVYYYMLCLGYRGMHRGNSREHGYLKQALLNTISSDYLLPSLSKMDELSPGTMQFTIKSQASTKLTNFSAIYRDILLTIVGVQIAIIIIVWFIYVKYKISVVA